MTHWYALLALAALADVLSTRYALRRGAYEVNPALGKRPSRQRLLWFKLVIGGGIAAVWHFAPPAQSWAYWFPVALWFAAAIWNVYVARKLK